MTKSISSFQDFNVKELPQKWTSFVEKYAQLSVLFLEKKGEGWGGGL